MASWIDESATTLRLPVSIPGLERPVQRGFGDVQRPAYFGDRVPFLIEVTGNAELSCGEGFGSAASSSSGAGSG
jgi:hypothetical protein